MTTRNRCLGLAATALVLLTIMVVGGAALGQEPLPEAEGPPQAIPAPGVAERAEALGRELRQIRDRIAPIEEIELIATNLDKRAAALVIIRTDTHVMLDGQSTLAKLSTRERDWNRHADEFASWRRVLTRRAATLETEVNQLKKTEAIWIATLEDAVATVAPIEVIDAIRRSILKLREAHESASKRRSQVLGLQNRVAQQELVVTESLEELRDARANLRRRLLDPEESPIWSAVGNATESGASIASAFETTRASAAGFLRQRQARLLTLGILFMLALLAALGLNRSIAARRESGATIDDSSRVFRRPISLALLVALLSIFWLFPLAPEALLDVVGFAILIPILRLLPPLMHPGFRRILYGVAGFYVLDRLRDLLEGAPLEGRIAFALECVAAALFCLALLRPARIPRIPEPDRFPHWPGPALKLGFAVFTVAWIANILGYLSLAELLGEGLLTSLYIAIGLYASVRVIGIVLDVTTRTTWAQGIHVLRTRRTAAVTWVKWWISFAAKVLWVYWSLWAFSIQDAVIAATRDLLNAPLTLGTVSISLGDVLAFGLTVAAAVLASRAVRFVLLEDVFTRIPTGRGIPHAVSATAHYAILFGGFLLALAAAGIDFSRFTLLAGAFGVGIGFGLQNVVNNFISGIILLYERPIQVGDLIDLGDLMGVVKRIGIRSSTVRSTTGAEVIVPNADLISQRVINWTLSDKMRRIDIPIGIKYGTDPEQVIAILTTVATEHPQVLDHPAPVALFRKHGESSLDFELRIWIANIDDWFKVESELNTTLNRVLAQAGVEIPFPQRDLHLRSVDANAALRLAGTEDVT